MSTIVAVKKNGKIAIAADSLTSYGSECKINGYLKNNSDKIVRIGESYVGLVGSASWKYIFREHFSDTCPLLNSEMAVAAALRDFHKVLVEKYLIDPNSNKGDFLQSHFAGTIVNQFGIFEFNSERTVVQFSRLSATGSGYKFAMGAAYTLFDTDADAEEIARNAVNAACEFDPASAGPVVSFALAAQEQKLLVPQTL